MGFRPAPDVVVGGKYRLTRRIARGGMGSVWQAKHQSLDSDIAVKLMSPSLTETPTALARFEREAKASAQLRSPHIVKVQDYGIDDETPFMVLELLEGEDLGQRIERVGRLPMGEVVRITTQVCKALAVAHDAGIVHRDLKPSNIFLAREGGDEVVKLFDFGIARETRSQLVDERTSSGVVLGSPHHMSPEQARGEPVDHRSDLWSLGVVIYRALTGDRPFHGENMTAVMLSVVMHPIPIATQACPDLPAAIDLFFSRALSRDVDQRFASALVMSEALQAIARGESADAWLAVGVGSRPPQAGREEPTLDAVAPLSRPDRQGSEATASRELRAVTAGLDDSLRPRRRRAWRAAPWAVLVLAIGGVGFLAGRARTETPPTTATAIGSDQRAPEQSAASGAGAPPDIVVEPVALVPASATATASGGAGPPEGSASPPLAAAPLVTPTAPPKPFSGKLPSSAPKPTPAPKIDPFTGLPIPP
jgi:eukaryotic-like serine/threonine-protein kinase